MLNFVLVVEVFPHKVEECQSVLKITHILYMVHERFSSLHSVGWYVSLVRFKRVMGDLLIIDLMFRK